MKFAIYTKYTLDEYILYNKVVGEKIYNAKRSRYILFAVYFILIIVFSLMKEYIMAFVIVIVCALVVIISKKIAENNIKNAYETNIIMKNADVYYKFYDDRVEVTSPKGIEIVEYSKIYKIIENDTNIYIMLGQNIGFIISKKNCNDDEIEFIKHIHK